MERSDIAESCWLAGWVRGDLQRDLMISGAGCWVGFERITNWKCEVLQYSWLRLDQDVFWEELECGNKCLGEFVGKH